MIGHLPDEMIETIMSFMSIEDRKSARLVCKRWHSISYRKNLIENDRITINDWMELDRISPTSRHVNVTVCYPSETRVCVLSKFWKRHGRDIKTLALSPIDYVYPLLPRILDCCPKLESIVLHGSEFGFTPNKVMSGVTSINLSKLRNLELRHINLLSPNGLNGLKTVFANVPRLEKLLVFGPNLFSDPDRCGKLALSLVKAASATLRELDISYLHVEDEIFREIIGVVGAQLTRLSIGFGLTEAKLNAVSEKCTHLKQFSADGDAELEDIDSEVQPLVDRLDQSTHISLYGIDLRDVRLPASFRLDTLVALNLDSTHVTSDTLITIFAEPHFKLEKISLDNLSCINSEVLHNICPNMPNLSYLSLNFVQLDNSALQTISKFNKKLKYLAFLATFASHDNVNRSTIDVTPLNVLTGLVYLELDNRDVTGLSSLILPNLNTIRLHAATANMTENDLRSLIENCPSLYKIDTYFNIIYGLENLSEDRKRMVKSSRSFHCDPLLFLLPPCEGQIMFNEDYY